MDIGSDTTSSNDAGLRYEAGLRNINGLADATASPIAQEDRRASERPVVSFYRSAKIHWQGLELLCLIRNVSVGGMKAKVLIDLPLNSQIVVEMRSGHRLNGRIVWCRDQHVGVEFAAPIDVQDVMNGAHCQVSRWHQRMPRMAVALPITLRTSVGDQVANLLDLSQGGAKVEAEFLRVGDDVTTVVPELEPFRGIVRWAWQGRAGIAFMRMVPFDMLAQWALDRQSEQGLLPRATPEIVR